MLGGNVPASLITFNEGQGKGAALPMAVTFEQVALRYIALSEPRWGVHTAATTKSVIRKHLIHDLGHLAVNSVTAKDVQSWTDGLVRSNASYSLLHKAVTHLRGILDLAQESGILRLNPMRSLAFKVDYRSRKPVSRRHLNYEDCGALLAETAGRDRLIIRMVMQLGLRPKELFALRHNDVKGEFIRIDEVLIKGRIKTVGSEDTALAVYVPPDLRLQLRKWLASTKAQKADWLFPDSRSLASGDVPPLSQDYFRNRILKPVAEKVGIQDVDFVALRRACADFFAQVATVQDTLMQMRQCDTGVTAESGGQSMPESLKRASATVEAEILNATKRAEKEVGPPKPTDKLLSSAAKARG